MAVLVVESLGTSFWMKTRLWNFTHFCFVTLELVANIDRVALHKAFVFWDGLETLKLSDKWLICKNSDFEKSRENDVTIRLIHIFNTANDLLVNFLQRKWK